MNAGLEVAKWRQSMALVRRRSDGRLNDGTSAGIAGGC
jgi:hypothetical protein